MIGAGVLQSVLVLGIALTMLSLKQSYDCVKNSESCHCNAVSIGECWSINSSNNNNSKVAPLQQQEHIGLFVGVLSRPESFEVRQAIRETWGADSRLARVMFFTLRPHRRPLGKEKLMALQAEATQYGDMHVVSEVLDSYWRITHAVLAIYRTAAALAGPRFGIQYVLKIDDDSYLRVPRLLEALADAPRNWTYAGYLETIPVPRLPAYYGISYEAWPKDGNVTYAWGGAGVCLSIDLAQRIAAGAAHMAMPHDKMAEVEDVATGLWLQHMAQQHKQAVNYHRYHWGDPCDPTTVSSHNIDAAHMRCMHRKGGLCCDEGEA